MRLDELSCTCWATKATTLPSTYAEEKSGIMYGSSLKVLPPVDMQMKGAMASTIADEKSSK